MRITLFLISAFASLILFVAEASACTCGDTTVAASKNYATIVFSGRIMKKVKSNAVEKDGVEVTFQVDRVWKGKVGPSVKIYSGPTSDLYDFMDLCSPEFELGDRYVVFARGEKLFSNIICSYTTKLEDGKDGNFVLDELGRGRRPTEESVTLTGEIVAHRWRDPESGDNKSVFLLQLEDRLETGSKNSEFVFVYVPNTLKLPKTIFEKRTFAEFIAVRTRTCDQSIDSYNDAAVEENRRVVEELRIKDRRENPNATVRSFVTPLPNLLKSLPPFDSDMAPRELTLKCYTVESVEIP